MNRPRQPLALILALASLALLAGCGPGAERAGEGTAEHPAAEPGPPARGAAPAPAPGPAPGSAAPAPETSRAGELAITIDDLPWVGVLPPGESRVQATTRLLAALARYDVPAAGFVDCGRVDAGAPALRLWLQAGQLLGNHTSNHVDLDRVEPAVWIGAARSCDRYLRGLTGDSVIYFRYPYLHRGRTAARYQAARQALAELGEPIAPVTIVTLDWLLAAAYGDALRAHDSARARAIGAELVEHVARTAAHYQEVARERVGHDVAHILLLHANALVADYLDQVLARLRADGFRFVALPRALEDPVYARPDDYIGPQGISWLYRFEPAAPELAAWDKAEEARLRAKFPR